MSGRVVRPVALVTGASGGIGEAFSEVLADHGYDLWLVARSEEKLTAIAARLRDRVDVVVHALDLAQPSAARTLSDTLAQRGVTLDVLVNNAGFGTHGAFAHTSFDDEVDEIELNVLTLVKLTKLIVPTMLARGRGRVCNVGSTASFQPGPFMAVYCATKAFVLSFSEAVNEELRGSGVTVSCLCPGATETGFQERAGMAGSRLLKAGVASARSVAVAGYEGMVAGKAVILPGPINRVSSTLPRLFPRRFITAVARRILEKT